MGLFIFSSLKSYFLKYQKLFRVSVSWNITNFLILEPESSISRKYKNFLKGVFFFYFLSLGLKIAGFHFRKYKKTFLLREYKNFLTLETEGSISWNMRNFFRGRFLLVFDLGLKSSISWNIRSFLELLFLFPKI